MEWVILHAPSPLHRVLGETSLELKGLALFGLFLVLVMGASFLSYWYVTETVVEDQVAQTGRAIAERVILATHWEGTESQSSRRPWMERIHDLREKLIRAGMPDDMKVDVRTGPIIDPKTAKAPPMPPPPRTTQSPRIGTSSRPIRTPPRRNTRRTSTSGSCFAHSRRRSLRAPPPGPTGIPPPDRRRQLEYCRPYRIQKGCSDASCHAATADGLDFDPKGPILGPPAPATTPGTRAT